ncbi:hypothetical protein [Streptomyces sp. 840.1]|nr:hypothetical protein [Streptomyces sp. 840.1]
MRPVRREFGADHPLIAALPPQHLPKKEISVFDVCEEAAADADLWFPS